MTYWIIENKLGTAAIGEELPKGSNLYDVRYLKDGINNLNILKGTIYNIYKDLSRGSRIIIRCQAGISRSNAIAIAVLCLYNKNSWEENEKIVREKVRRTQIESSLKDCCKRVLYGE